MRILIAIALLLASCRDRREDPTIAQIEEAYCKRCIAMCEVTHASMKKCVYGVWGANECECQERK